MNETISDWLFGFNSLFTWLYPYGVLEPGRFPAPAPKATAFLERNRLYVAMTRAKQRLWLMENAARRVQPFDH